MKCENCGKEVEGGMGFCPECGTKVTQVQQDAPVQESAASVDLGDKAVKGKLSNIPVAMFGIAAVAVVLLIVLLGSLLGKNDVEKIVSSAQKTAFSKGSNFEVSLTASLFGESQKTSVKGWYTIDTKDEKIVVYTDSDTDEGAYLIEDGKVYTYSLDKEDAEDDEEYEPEVNEAKLSKMIDVDQEVIFDLIKDLGKKDLADIDYAKYIEELDSEVEKNLEDVIEVKKIGKAIEAVIKTLNKNSEDCLGLEKEKDGYSFEIEVYDTLEVCLESLEKYLEEDAFEALEDGIKNSKDTLKDLKIEGEIKMDGKYISEVEVDLGIMKLNVTFEDVNKCKEELPSKIEKKF